MWSTFLLASALLLATTSSQKASTDTCLELCRKAGEALEADGRVPRNRDFDIPCGTLEAGEKCGPSCKAHCVEQDCDSRGSVQCPSLVAQEQKKEKAEREKQAKEEKAKKEEEAKRKKLEEDDGQGGKVMIIAVAGGLGFLILVCAGVSLGVRQCRAARVRGGPPRLLGQGVPVAPQINYLPPAEVNVEAGPTPTTDAAPTPQE